MLTGRGDGMLTAYLGGPDVFMREAAEVAEWKRERCLERGIRALIPSDNGEHAAPTPERPTMQRAIYLDNLGLIAEADIGIFNLSPFRGPSADVGTCVELGIMIGAGKPVYGYSNDGRAMMARMGGTIEDVGGRQIRRDAMDYLVEDFGGFDNLMITEAIAMGGLPAFLAEPGESASLAAPKPFLRCIAAIGAAMADARREPRTAEPNAATTDAGRLCQCGLIASDSGVATCGVPACRHKGGDRTDVPAREG